MHEKIKSGINIGGLVTFEHPDNDCPAKLVSNTFSFTRHFGIIHNEIPTKLSVLLKLIGEQDPEVCGQCKSPYTPHGAAILEPKEYKGINLK